MISFTLTNINADFESYQQIINLYSLNKDHEFEDIELSFEEWFSANLSAALGSVLDLLSSNMNEIHIQKVPDNIKSIIQKNNFLSHYGFVSQDDLNSTTIKYIKLKPTDGRFFNRYVAKELLNRPELPHMTQNLKKKITESIYEIFVNAQIHSETQFIYTCGQFYPQKELIEFTITDTGIGFKNRINDRFNSTLSSLQAIKWATSEGHSTKKNISGGIGLALLKEFIKLNNGTIQIVSGDGFYQISRNREFTRQFQGSFPGTLINMQFKTNDPSSYYLSKDDSDDLF